MKPSSSNLFKDLPIAPLLTFNFLAIPDLFKDSSRRVVDKIKTADD